MFVCYVFTCMFTYMYVYAFKRVIKKDASKKKNDHDKCVLALSCVPAKSQQTIHRRHVAPAKSRRGLTGPVPSQPSSYTTRAHENQDDGHLLHACHCGGPPVPNTGRLLANTCLAKTNELIRNTSDLEIDDLDTKQYN